MRCFLAVDLDGGLKEKVADIQKGLAGFDVNLVSKENLHFTLKFLGEVNEEVIEEVKSKARKIASSFSPFSIDINGMGAFPSLNYARVVWIGAKQLYALQKAVDDTLADIFGREENIVPHLTLARVRSSGDKDALRNFIEASKNVGIGTMVVGEIKLKISVVTRKGPVYEDVEIFSLE
ncbi:MAG: RNA 2',3'-cyclic phosphodiesterase [Candidatus Aenigmarchaeota archaeon]|nr:RNA 2',3'-cyclic phosphodiesterase [Candidatus Aenigmarchaeota archaeon]